ncbi:DEAD/DEAH box helicase [Aliiglaciecola sp. CAU 1673]|uniref:DEAD/DEAH box helicase n=1 Tax=Aliiglaciecola sp. CAU 1673 TaxID=3032595 RepID=UPI0023D9B39D|nr:DEAD/DEAH box helicase [Aliiglaciecola sp. CAU 1673]MDF2179798.1 DEAD/DEAH box helicase [Aliiglaciecola sp. CAU 1673]
MLFSDLPLDHRLQHALHKKGFEEATEIQSKAIPHGLLGKDLIVSSKTGSGKTLAYLIPAINRVMKTKALSKRDPRVLILAPTRELAKQVFLQLKVLLEKGYSAALILGGENFNDQVKALRRDPQFIVGTAGRIADHLTDKSLFLNGLEMLILDEADRMLDLGFAPQLNQIHKAADHRKRQTLMFSATLDNVELNLLTKTLLKGPQRISLGSAGEQHEDIEQRFILADHIEHKEALLKALLKVEKTKQAILFTATREDTERLATLLKEWGYAAAALSGNLNQGQRSNIMNEFSRGHHQVLVTTDVASRGLDLLKVALVVNFDMPKQAEEYVHRIGRTGRAGNKGEAVSLVGPKDWQSYQAVKALLEQEIEFTAIEGLEAKFKGLKVRKAKAQATADSTTSADSAWKDAKPKTKRINTFAGVDVGDKVLAKRKPRKVIEEPLEEDDEEIMHEPVPEQLPPDQQGS